MKKRSIIICIVFLISIFLINSFAFSAVDPKEERGAKGYSEGFFAALKNLFAEDWKVNSRVNLLFGHDNNVHLNTERRGSEFWETLWRVDFSKKLNDNLKGKAGYQFLNILYTGSDDSTFYKNTVRLGLENEFLERFTGFVDFDFDFVDYSNDSNGNYRGYHWDIGVKEKISKNLYHQLTYEYLFRDYVNSVIRNDDNSVGNTESKRDDRRHGINYEVGRYFKKFLAKTFYEYYTNDSNQKYLNYYDYDSHKIGSSLTYLFNKKFTGYMSLAHQWKLYNSRGTVADPRVTADDKAYIFNSSLFYKLNEKATLGLSYTFRENVSNEPSQEYAGSVVTTGVYYKF